MRSSTFGIKASARITNAADLTASFAAMVDAPLPLFHAAAAIFAPNITATST